MHGRAIDAERLDDVVHVVGLPLPVSSRSIILFGVGCLTNVAFGLCCPVLEDILSCYHIMPTASFVATSPWSSSSLSSAGEMKDASACINDDTLNNISPSFVESNTSLTEKDNEDDDMALKRKGPGRPKQTEEMEEEENEHVRRRNKLLGQPDKSADATSCLVVKRKGLGRSDCFNASPKKLDKEDTNTKRRKRRQPDFYTPPLILLTKEKSVGRIEKLGNEETECLPIKKKKKLGRPTKKVIKSSADTTHVEDVAISAIRSREWRSKKDAVGGQKGYSRESADIAALVMVQKKGPIRPKKSDKEEAECASIKRKRGRPKKSADTSSFPHNNVKDGVISMTMAAIHSREWRAKRVKAGGKKVKRNPLQTDLDDSVLYDDNYNDRNDEEDIIDDYDSAPHKEPTKRQVEESATKKAKEKEIPKIIVQWLLKFLPHLRNEVVLLEEYARHLYDGGFDSMEILEGGYLNANDLQFMKIGHKRVIERHL